MSGLALLKNKKLLILPPLIIGVGILAVAVSNKKPPQLREAVEMSKPARVMTIEPMDFVPRALGYGYAQPKKQLATVAEISGRITYRNPDLLNGRILPAGAVLFEIDRTDYELERESAQADLISIGAQIEEIDTKIANLQASLRIEKELVSLSEKELARKEQLLKRGTASQAQVDQARTSLLGQRQKVQDLENENRILPAQKSVLMATKRQNETRLASANEDLDRTRIVLPFDARIAQVEVEAGEYVTAGQKLVEADGIDTSEVTAQVTLSHFASLMQRGRKIDDFDPTRAGEIMREFGITARIRAVNLDTQPVWNARLDRINDSIDSGTRTLGVIVAVDDPYRRAVVGTKPPLVKNLYVEVELRGPAKMDHVVVPYRAIHRSEEGADIVYLVGADKRLEAREVTLGPVQGNIAVIAQGVEPGEKLVLTDLIPAISGMLVEGQEDETTKDTVRRAAAGEGLVK